MPITIKEILPSDSMSGVVEKINFNFDQLILAGGGPPGPAGPQGVAGVPGPEGARGDQWFVGPSAFSQTSNHTNDPLKIEDHYLDINGDVFAYYDISGVTGWTFTGINLKGPTGDVGSTGSSNEWQIWPGVNANAISSPGWEPGATQDPNGTVFPDYMTTKKGTDLLFLGDVDWGYNKLINYGRSELSNQPNQAPKIALIQNQLSASSYGLNGLAFGAYGATGGQPGTGGTYYAGGASTINDAGATTHAKNFGYLGLYQDDLNWMLGNTTYYTKFGIRTHNIPIKIEAGRGGGNSWWSAQPLELLGNVIRISGYEAGNAVPTYRRQILLSAETDISSNGGTVNGKVVEISINSNSFYGGVNSSVLNKFGYISLQGNISNASSTIPFGKEHQYTSVIIGPTFGGSSVSGGRVLGIDGYQGLAISRKITANTVFPANGKLINPQGQAILDTSIALLYSDYKDSSDTSTFSARIGQITAVRGLADVATSGAIIDNIIIAAGDGPGGLTNANNLTGRIGIQNKYSGLRKPQMPFHVQMEFLNGDPAGSRSNAYDGGYTYGNGTLIQGWIAGFDAYTGQKRATGLGIGYKGWQEGINAGVPNSFYTNPVLNTYYRTDNNQSYPSEGAGFGPTYTGYTVGINNPHLYIQTGGETSSGNVGIGIYPNPNYTPGSNTSQMIAAYSKLSVAGSVTIAGQQSGYHLRGIFRPENGIVVEGLYIQGATTIQDVYSTIIFGGTGIKSSLGGGIVMSLNGAALARNFISRGADVLTYTPDFSLPDTKTGMMQFSSDPIQGNGYLVASPDVLTIPSATGPTQTTAPIPVAKFTARGEAGYTANTDYPGFVAQGAIAQKPTNVGASQLSQYLWRWSTGGGVFQLMSVWQIPVQSSTVILNLYGTSGQTTVKYWNSQFTSIQTSPNTFLDGTGGTTEIGGIPAPRYNMQGFTLENGHYDGQVLDLVILNIDPKNQGVLLPSIPSPLTNNSSQTVSANLISSVLDNICMQAEPYDTSIGMPYNAPAAPFQFGWPFQQGTQMQYENRKIPYSLPYSAYSITQAQVAQNVFPIQAVDTVWTVDKNSWFRNRFGLWSDIATANSQTGQGSYTTSPSGVGFGAFRIASYKTIKFVWRFDGSGTGGCWYEISRANLVNRLSRSWVAGSGNSGGSPTDTPIDFELPTDDPIVINPPTGNCCFVADTMITMSNGEMKPIQEIQPGDLILSYSILNSEVIENEVGSVSTPTRNDIYTIIFDNGVEVGITPDHPIYSPSKGWLAIDPVKAKSFYSIIDVISKIEIGDSIMTENGTAQVESIEFRTSELTKTYTLTTKDESASTYFANGILAHNLPLNLSNISISCDINAIFNND